MLQSIRNRAQGWIAGVIVGLICLTFALFGVNSYMNEAGSVEVAVINGKGVGLGAYQVAYSNYRRQIENVLGDQVNIAELNQDILKKEALNQLIDSELLGQIGSEEGMRISDAQVAVSINSFEAFQRDGQFSQELYERRTRDIGLSPAGFEQQMRKDLLNEQIRLGIEKSNFVTPAQVEQVARTREQTRDIGYSLISAKDFIDQVEVTDEKLQSYYQDNLDKYMTQEEVRVAYLELSLNVIADSLEFSEEDLKNFYESHKNDFTIKEQRSANHILVHVPNEASEEDEDAARKKAQDLMEQAKAGADFEELAKNHSDDVGSKAEGGATGFFARGFMVPGFDEVVFAMQPGEISEPVRTTFGFHIIRLNEIKQGGQENFEQARNKVVSAYQQAQAQERFFAMAEELSNLAFENEDSLQPASDALGIQIQTTDFFTDAGGEGLSAERAFITASFSDEVKGQGLNSKPVELSENHLVVLRIDDHKPARQQTFDEVVEAVTEAYRSSAARELAYARGREILTLLKSGAALEEVVANNQIEWKKKDNVDRQSEQVSRAVLRNVFKLGRPQGDSPLFGGVPIGTGDFAVMAVYQVNEPQTDELKGKLRDDIGQALTQTTTRSGWKDFVGLLRDSAQIDIFSERL